MGITNKSSEEKFLEIFKRCLKIDPRTISVSTLLSDRNLRRIKHNPYYQRNYVWDRVKQSFFIESVILGTEIPPLIFYKNGLKIEVIDGRQRFETLKKFKESTVKLDGRGLMSLDFLSDRTISTLEPNLRDTFWSSNIRIFEFEVVNYPEMTPEIEDKIKKEIFRRYNTGITPLTSVEVDNAKYINDKLTELFNQFIIDNDEMARRIASTFVKGDDFTGELPPADISNYLRRLYILDKFPISKYAGGSNRVEMLDLLYDFAAQRIEGDEQEEFNNYLSQITEVLDLRDSLVKTDSKLNNKLIYETILWAIRILKLEKQDYSIDKQHLTAFLLRRINVYSNLESHYYGNILKRFNCTAEYFNDLTGYDFSLFIKDPNFASEIKNELAKRSETDNTIEKFQNLRYNKPGPISTPIDEIIMDVRASKYTIRPSYQRQEKISLLKASSIIESILLGINLPPVFIFKTKEGIKEVIDGQQRLLSILGFLGKDYKNEKGEFVPSKNNSFKIKGLKILQELNGSTYLKLTEDYQEKILDFTIDLIVIEEALNKNFDPTDLFIRLNNKPYPIKDNSFEMWNSTVDSEVIQNIKTVTNTHIEWFFIKETTVDPDERNDRMDNEEFITILSYIMYNSHSEDFDKIIGFFRRNDSITCRLKYKTGLTESLVRLEKEANERELFLKCIEDTNKIIESLGLALNPLGCTKEDLNSFLNFSGKTIFRRSLQDFYIIWIYLLSFDQPTDISPDKIATITELLKIFRNDAGYDIDDQYIKSFQDKLQSYYL